MFELDMEVSRPRPQPYTVEIDAFGGTFRQVFNLTVPREEPPIPLNECEEKSKEWYDWREHLRYKQGILYYKDVIDVLMEYHEKIAIYIHQNCIPEEHWADIVTEDDWDKVYKAALCPEVEMEDLKYVAEKVFIASYDGMPLFDAFENEIEGGLGSYLSIRAWEVKLRKELHMSEEEYTQLGVMERAIMIMAERVPDMISQIDIERSRRKMRERKKGNDGSSEESVNNPQKESASD